MAVIITDQHLVITNECIPPHSHHTNDNSHFQDHFATKVIDMFDRIISRWLPWSVSHSLTKFFTKQKRKHPCVEIKYDLIEHIIGGDTPCFDIYLLQQAS